MEQHRIQTRFGPVDVRVYRLREGWWPVPLAGRERLPADPALPGEPLPQTAAAAVRRMAEVIDAMTLPAPQRLRPPARAAHRR